jgi:hypothetical protein
MSNIGPFLWVVLVVVQVVERQAVVMVDQMHNF